MRFIPIETKIAQVKEFQHVLSSHVYNRSLFVNSYKSLPLTTRLQHVSGCTVTLQCYDAIIHKKTDVNLLMYQSNRSLNPPGHLNFSKIFVQIPPSRG